MNRFSFSRPSALAFLLGCLTACGPGQGGVPPSGGSISEACYDVERPEHWSTASHCRGAAPDYNLLFDDTKVDRIDILVSRENYEFTQDDLQSRAGIIGPPGSNPESPPWVPVTIEHGGRIWTNVAMRYKGNSSLAFPTQQGRKKIGFRLSFDRYEDEHPEILDQRFYGFKKMTFSSGFLDPSLIREKLAADIFRAAGLASARGAFVRIFIEYGEGPVYMGLYTMIEDPSNKFLDSQFENGTGNLYKPEGEGARLATFREQDLHKKTNEEEGDFSDIQAMIEALNAPRTDPAAWRRELETHFDVRSFLKYLALNQAMMDWDTYGRMDQNYYLYQDIANDRRLTWIPWDLNETFMNRGPASAQDIHLVEISADWPLIRFLLDDPIYKEAYYDALRESSENEFSRDFIVTRIEAYHALIAPYVVGENGERAPHTLLGTPRAFERSLTGPQRGLIPHLDWRLEEVQKALDR